MTAAGLPRFFATLRCRQNFVSFARVRKLEQRERKSVFQRPTYMATSLGGGISDHPTLRAKLGAVRIFTMRNVRHLRRNVRRPSLTLALSFPLLFRHRTRHRDFSSKGHSALYLLRRRISAADPRSSLRLVQVRVGAHAPPLRLQQLPILRPFRCERTALPLDEMSTTVFG